MIQQTRAPEAARLLKEHPEAVYLDVRTEPEYQQGHTGGAYNVPVVFFDASRRPVPNPDFEKVVQATLSKGTKIVVGCQSGVRSMKAADILTKLGYTDVTNLEGGFGGARDQTGQVTIAGWKDSGLPVEHGDTPGRSYADLKKADLKKKG